MWKGKWTYGLKLGTFSDGHGEMNVAALLDSSGQVKNIVERSKWHMCLRLVNDDVVDTSSLDLDGTNTCSDTKVTSFHRRNLAGTNTSSNTKVNSSHQRKLAPEVPSQRKLNARSKLGSFRGVGTDNCTANITPPAILQVI